MDGLAERLGDAECQASDQVLEVGHHEKHCFFVRQIMAAEMLVCRINRLVKDLISHVDEEKHLEGQLDQGGDQH